MIRRSLLVVAVLVGAWLVAAFFLFARPHLPPAPAHVDAVVVLSGARNARLDPGVALIRKGAAPVLAISGALQDPHWLKARTLCRARHVARARVICFEPRPFSTRGEARAIAALARQHRWDTIIVVTSTFHVTRARMLFHRCYPGKLWFVGTPTTWWRIPEEWASETGKLAVQLTAERGC